MSGAPLGPGLTVFDADWRPMLWDEPAEYRVLAAIAAARADIVLGGDGELEAAGLGPDAAATVVIKHGPGGATVYEGGEAAHVAGRPVKVTNGLGAGDAFAAAFGAALLAGRDARGRGRRGQRCRSHRGHASGLLRRDAHPGGGRRVPGERAGARALPPRARAGSSVEVTPVTAGWRWLSFSARRLPRASR